MIFEDSLQAFLGSSPYALPVTGVYSHRTPQTTPEGVYLVIYRVAAAQSLQHTGAPPSIEQVYQLSAFGPAQSEVLEVADDLRRLMHGYRGAMGSYFVYSSVFAGGRHLWEEGRRLHQYASDFRIIHSGA